MLKDKKHCYSGLSLIFPVGGGMKKVAGRQDFFGVRPQEGGAQVKISG